MRRFLTLVCLLCLAIPAGISISGCTRNPGADYCNGLGYGMKITDVAAISLSPATTGISMAYGQTRQVNSPAAVTCKNSSATVSGYTYGTSNNQLVDIAPTGNMCAGTWNRNSGGGIANYTICSPPNPLPSTGGLPYATAYVTASAQSVVSNPVEVYVHAPVTSVTLVTTPKTGSAEQCLSQYATASLDAQACFSSNNTQYEFCAPASVTSTSTPGYVCPLPPGVTSVPSCTAALGTLTYSVGNSAVATTSTNTTTNQVSIEALQPGTTAITASVANSGSSAGYFSTCPPASISLTLPSGATSGTITKAVTEDLVTTVYDTKGQVITGLGLNYQSTDPMDISVTGGSITTTFPGVASIYAICQPSSCNSAPINEFGWYGTGLSITSNPVTITYTGTASDYAWFAAPGQSQYVFPIELLTGTVGSSARLPYVPNSMVMDRLGSNIYFGSANGLMTFSTASSSLSSQSTGVPGVVLAVSPNNQTVLINDQARHLFYLYSTSGGGATTFGGMGNAAAWTPDSQTLYITDNAALNNAASGITGHTDTLYVYNLNNWTTYPLPPSPLPAAALPSSTLPPNVAVSDTQQTPAIVIPSVGAYLRGGAATVGGTPSTVAHTWCPTGTVGNYESMIFYPQSDSVAVQSDVLAATTDGQHILSAAVTGTEVVLNDIGISIPTVESPIGIPTPIPCQVTTTGTAPNQVQTLTALHTNPVLKATLPVTLNSTIANTAINQVVTSPESNLAFLTYTNTGTTSGATLPYYVPGSVAMSYVTLTGNSVITAPLTGAFTPDDKLFFVSTAGDNKIHYITLSPLAPPVDSQQISPNLPACTPVSAGGLDAGCAYSGPNPGTAIVPATAIAVKPRSTT
ncbi:MAG: hypothetical protein ABSF70_08140 [Terracidiphilus sp.]|jgi:hypothetical protein